MQGTVGLFSDMYHVSPVPVVLSRGNMNIFINNRKLKLYCEKHIKLEILNHFFFAFLDKLKVFLSPDYLGGYPQPPTLG